MCLRRSLFVKIRLLRDCSVSTTANGHDNNNYYCCLPAKGLVERAYPLRTTGLLWKIGTRGGRARRDGFWDGRAIGIISRVPLMRSPGNCPDNCAIARGQTQCSWPSVVVFVNNLSLSVVFLTLCFVYRPNFAQ